ncbi:MAG TPA: VCBS repeat-containing protein [Terriglobales bacterium]|nr:VCBS repeat-containing protein [Terriglobales bacterium]
MKLVRLIHRLFPIALAALGLFSLLAFLPVLHRDLEQPASHLVKFALAQGSTHFAIADFDGDLRPDLAMIRVSRYGAPQTEYSVELKFSTGSRSPIGLIGPAGGLEVFPQDVNGDQFTDLVITSVMDAEFVAILLNDGKGNFTRVDRAEYPLVGKHTDSRLLAPLGSTHFQFALGQGRNWFGDEEHPSGRQIPHPNSFELAQASTHAPIESAARWNSGRAPPRS